MAPPTKKDISENPSADAVTSPTDPAFKSKDIDRKMKLYAVFEAFRSGNYPSNEQIDKTLKYVNSNSPINESALSSDGQKLIDDVKKIIETARKLVANKNRDELFQEFLWHTRQVDYSKGNLKDLKSPVDKDTASADGQQAAEHLRTLAKLIFTNSEFRKLLKDSTFLSRDVLADTLAKAADLTRPDEAQLAATDEPAPSNQWEGPNGETRDHTQAAPDTGLKSKREAAAAKKEEAKTQAQRDTEEIEQRVDGVASASTSQDAANTEAAKKEGKKNLISKTWGRVPEEHKDRAKEHYQSGKDYLADKFPEERRQRYIYRLKKVVVENQRHQDYQDAIEFFLQMAETYGGHAKIHASGGGDRGLAVWKDPTFSNAQKELRTLLERFANDTSFQPVIDAVDQIYKDADKDAELRAWFSKIDKYVRQVLQEPGYVMRDDCDNDGRKIWDDGKVFWDGKYKAHKDALFETISTFFTSFADDPLNKQFGEDITRLTKHLFMDADGQFKYKPHLAQDLQKEILPSLFKHVGYIPVPRIEYTDSALDLVIENLTLESENLLPNVFEIEARNYFKFSPRSEIGGSSKHSFWISFAQIQADLKDVAFYVRKKSGFPRISDSGLADVRVSGKGIQGKVHIESTSAKGSVFTVKEVKCKVDKIKFAIRDSKHSVLYAMVKPLAMNLIKKQIAKALQDAIKNGLSQLDSQLVETRDKMDEAKASEEGSRKQVLKETFSRNSTKSENGDTASEKKQSQFRIVAKRDSKILDWASKDSIVEKQGVKQAAEKKSKEGQSPTWKSSDFDIVD